ncbi:MAG: sigma-70 family RNA polymerase sigma factor [Myxococcales bacterium]|nr:sigma-70 family RNA polymerase sigma factor [Myxococcales bacterium]MCB9519892.1 sigma-70 family RNA polymerase sigma factor [Myxococcales bacterium]MCB9533201.1 sigma-70 family RNA polymerase sigma factor [Myxococcales bacterium]
MTSPKLDPLEFQQLILSLAHRLRVSLHLRAPIDELVQLGNVGLLEALQRYDPDSGVSPVTFAYHRIRGAMIDGVRAASGTSQAHVRAYTRQKAAEEFMESYAHSASNASDAEYLAGAVRGVAFATDMAELTEVDASSATDGATPYTSRPDRLAQLGQVRAMIEAVLDDLPADEARLLRGHYLDGRSLKSMGDDVGLSRSWISRIHTRGLRNARRLFRERFGTEFSDLFDGN